MQPRNGPADATDPDLFAAESEDVRIRPARRSPMGQGGDMRATPLQPPGSVAAGTSRRRRLPAHASTHTDSHRGSDADVDTITDGTAVTWIDSPVGPLLAVARGDALVGLHFTDEDGPFPEPGWIEDDRPFADLRRQLDQYFRGRRSSFEVALDPQGTPVQQQGWDALGDIPYGATASYGEVAEAIGRPGAMRAVGGANGANPIPILIPCHRVIAADGTLGGFGGGLERKVLLLELEGASFRR
jgi:methylated-DNA-[protein]-cysteine S-methyltransferase